MKLQTAQKRNLRVFVTTAMLAAVAGVLMSFEVSLPMMPVFYKLDFSDVPAIIGTFAYGPVSGISIALIKLVIKLILSGTNSAFVGELANVIGIVFFIFPIWLVYRGMGRTRRAAKVSLAVSVPVRVAFSCLVNAFITLPMYAAAYGTTIDGVVLMVSSFNSSITNLGTFIILATIPFNLVKGILNCFIGYVLYTRLDHVHAFGVKKAEAPAAPATKGAAA